MRCHVALKLLPLAALSVFMAAPLYAVPITTGTGPGGYGLTNGSSALRIWLVGDTATAGSVASWTDSSGSGNTATQAVALQRPTATASSLNGHTVLFFAEGDGTRDSLDIPDAADLDPTTSLSMVAVAQVTDTAGRYNGLLSKHSNGGWTDGWGLDVLGNVGVGLHRLEMWTVGGQKNPPIPLFSAAPYHVLAGDLSTTASAVRVDGVTSTGTGVALAANSSIVRIGHDTSHPTYNLLGSMAEVIFTNVGMNTAERRIVDNYLSGKYNLGGTVVSIVNNTLGANDRYAGDLSTIGNYDSDIFGVGREDASNQLLSTGAAGFGVETVSLDDGDYLMAGHNVTTNSIVLIDNYDLYSQEPTIGERWDRVWYVDKTGALDATLGFDFEDAGLVSPGGTNNYQLLYSADDNFTDGWQILAQTTSITGGLVTFNVLNANLLDGYYTLGLNIQSVPEPSTWGITVLGGLGLLWQRRRRNGRRCGG